MGIFFNSAKDILIRSGKYAGQMANRVIKATKFKTTELTDLNKKRELINALGAKVYELTQNGFVPPEGAAELVNQIAALDADLAVLRANNEARKAADAQQRATEKATRAAEKAASKTAATIEETTAPVEVQTEAPAAPTMDATTEPAEQSAGNDVPTLNV